MNCDVCGTKMSRFDRGKDRNGNPVYEYLCPKEGQHARMLREASGQDQQRQDRAAKGAAARKGKPSPGSGNPQGRGKR